MKLERVSFFSALILLIFALQARAGDLSADVRTGANNPHAGDGNYLELGSAAVVGTSPIYGLPEGNSEDKVYFGILLSANFRYQYKNFFAEGAAHSLEATTLGYHLADNEHWSLDAVMLQQNGEISKSLSKDLEGIKKRQADYMLGFRATGYYENYIIQMHALTDDGGAHGGQDFTFKVGRYWQYKNWNLHAIQAVRYNSEAIANYYFSVQHEDASEKFPEFHAKAGLNYVFELGATYPLSQKWVFRSSLRHVELERQWAGSPLIVSTHVDAFINSISYVF